MSIKTANFAVIRDNTPFKCKGSELLSTLSQKDMLLVSRNDVIHKVKLPLNLDKVASVQNKSVNLNYKQYAFCRDRDTGQRLAESSPPFANAQQERRVYEHLFDGNEYTTFKSYTTSGVRHELVIQFPKPIDVYGSIRIKAGFHIAAQTGQMLINGRIVRELTAWDDEPKVFSANFTGQVSEFSIRQKNAANTSDYTAVLNYIEIDGAKLVSSVRATELTLSSEADMSKYKVNMRIKKYNSNITGIIGAVDEANKKITLTASVSFSANDDIIIDQVDGNPVEIPEILDTDIFACTDVDNITYKVTGAQFKAIFEPPRSEIKRVVTDKGYINDNTFLPSNVIGSPTYNKWSGNIREIYIKTIDGENLLDYVGSYSDVIITFTRTDNDAIIYKGYVTKIKSSSAVSNTAALELSKIATNNNEWPLNTDINIDIEGLF